MMEILLFCNIVQAREISKQGMSGLNTASELIATSISCTHIPYSTFHQHLDNRWILITWNQILTFCFNWLHLSPVDSVMFSIWLQETPGGEDWIRSWPSFRTALTSFSIGSIVCRWNSYNHKQVNTSLKQVTKEAESESLISQCAVTRVKVNW